MTENSPDYSETQRRREAEYLTAWNELDPTMREQLANAGIAGPDTGNRVADDVGRDEDVATSSASRGENSHWPSIADNVDKLSDLLMEQFGVTPIQATQLAEFVGARVRQATMETQSTQLARIVGFFLAGSDNLQARAHGLAQAARMAASNGLGSLRQSARDCGVSPEWMRRVAWRWCQLLDLPPLEGAKSEAAREAYREDKKNNHWRHQKCKQPTPKQTL